MTPHLVTIVTHYSHKIGVIHSLKHEHVVTSSQLTLKLKAHRTRKPDLKENVITYKVETSEWRFLQLYPSDKAGLQCRISLEF